jgi:hypothetical protein
MGILGLCCGLRAQSAAPLILSESADFPSHFTTGVYANIGTLGLGTNTISGSVSGHPSGTTYVGDFDDSFSLTLPPGLLLSKIQLTISNYDFGGTGGGACALNVNGVSPSGVFGLPTFATPKCLGAGSTTYTYTSPNDYSTQTPGTFPVYLASPFNSIRLASGAFNYSLSFFTTVAPTPITIATPPTLPSGAVATLYSQALKATGGTSYTWQLVSGALPSGLSLSSAGVITGTPTVAGTFSFIARAVDNGSFPILAAQQTFSLTITAATENFSSALRIPQLVDGAGWKMVFAIVNIDQQPVNYNFRFWDDNGSPLALPILNGTTGTLSGTLAPGATAFAETPGTSPQQLQGWAEVASGGRIGVTAIFRYTAGGVDSQGTANGILSGSSVFMSFDNTQGYTTGLALANTNPTQSLSVSMTFQADTGAQTTGLVLLPPHGHATFVVPTAFPASAGTRGSVNVTASSPDIAVLGLRFTPSLSFTSLGTFE